MSTQGQYPTDATDGQWHLLQRLLPKPRWQPGGEGGVAARCLWRQVLNRVLYVTKTGCQWRQLPPSFGRWSTISGYFNRWAQEGIWQRIHTVL
jgi:transposase